MVKSDISSPEVTGNTNPPEAYVYVISAGDDAVKVGLARDPCSRLRALQTGHYRKLFIAHQVGFPTVDEAYAIERRAHKLLTAKRIEGEWFSVSADEARSAIEQAISGIEDERRLEEEARRSAMEAVKEGEHVYLGPEVTLAEPWMSDPKDIIKFVLAQKNPLKSEYLFNFGDCMIFVAKRTDEGKGEHFFFMNDVSQWHMREEDGSPYNASRLRKGNPLGEKASVLFATIYEPSRVAP